MHTDTLWDRVPLVRPADWNDRPILPCARCGKPTWYDCSGLWACYECFTLTEADGSEHVPPPRDPTSTALDDVARETAHYREAERQHVLAKLDNHYGYL